ncbi:MAG: hypothetical protein HY273_12165 [Gammaproteobacteria bacterium]|nr:hypothetical protein [Gammaproteobacteria bacterium]
MLQHYKNYARAGATVIALLGTYSATLAMAADMGMSTGTVAITSPKDGATLSAMGENKMDYEVKLGAGDDHFHVWIDGERGGPVRDLKGTLTLPKMTPGKHAIIVKIVDKAHVPAGPEKSVSVKVE